MSGHAVDRAHRMQYNYSRPRAHGNPHISAVARVRVHAAMVAEVGGVFGLGTLTYVIPSPNTTVFSVLWPPSITLWESSVFPYTLVVQQNAFIGT